MIGKLAGLQGSLRISQARNIRNIRHNVDFMGLFAWRLRAGGGYLAATLSGFF